MAGKGDTPRPFAVDEQTYADNWNRTFGAKPSGSPTKVENDNGQGSQPDQERSGPT